MAYRYLVLLALAAACSDTDDKDTATDDADTDTDADTDADADADTDSDADSDADADADADTDAETVEGIFFVGDLMTGAPIVGADASDGTQTTTTNADGEAIFDLPAASMYTVTISPPDGPPIRFLGETSGEDLAMSRFIPTYDTLDLLGGLLGATYDATKGILSVNVVRPATGGGYEPLADTTVDIDLAYGLVLVNDSTSLTGYAVSNTTIAGNSSIVMFVNADTGPTLITVTPPAGYACRLFSSDTALADAGVTIDADTFTTLTVICEM